MIAPSHVEQEIWHDVKLNVSARLTLGNAALAASNAAPAKVARPDQLFMRTSIFSGSRNPRKAVYILKKKHCQSSNNFLDSFSNLPKLRFLDLIVLSFSNLPKLRFLDLIVLSFSNLPKLRFLDDPRTSLPRTLPSMTTRAGNED